MATEIRVPKIAASATKASIGRWFKQVGDPVSLDEPLVEIETDGATVEVTASATGVLSDILFVGRRRRKGRYVAGNDYRVGRQYEDRWCALNVSDFPHTRTIETAVSAHVIKAFSRIRSQKWATSTNIQSRLSTRLNFPVSGTPRNATPAGISPVVTMRHSAIRSFRATATIIVVLRFPAAPSVLD